MHVITTTPALADACNRLAAHDFDVFRRRVRRRFRLWREGYQVERNFGSLARAAQDGDSGRIRVANRLQPDRQLGP